MPNLEDSFGGYGGGASQILSGLFSNSDQPYKKASGDLGNYLNQAKDYQNPFYSAGTNALPQFQDWLSKMKDPSGFINQLMSGYSQSPFAKTQQQNAVRAATNYGSATGLTGSTPLIRQEQQNANEISEGDINDWLSKVLGINTEYGTGEQNLITGGQNAANNISDLLKSFGIDIAKMNFGANSERNQNRNNIFSGAFDLASKFF